MPGYPNDIAAHVRTIDSARIARLRERMRFNLHKMEQAIVDLESLTAQMMARYPNDPGGYESAKNASWEMAEAVGAIEIWQSNANAYANALMGEAAAESMLGYMPAPHPDARADRTRRTVDAVRDNRPAVAAADRAVFHATQRPERRTRAGAR